jgi:molybdenum cofactor cytidylyltransferase
MQLHRALRLTLDPEQPDVIAIVGGGGKSSAVFRIGLELAHSGRRAVITHTARIAAFQTDWSPAVVAVEHDAAVLPWTEIGDALDAHNVCLLTGPIVGDRRAGLAPHLVDSLAQAAAGLGLHAISVEADGSKMRPAKAPAEHEPVLPASTTLLAPMLGLDAVGAEITGRAFHRAELVRAVLNLPAEDARRFTPQQAARLLVSGAAGAKARPVTARLLPIFNKADHPLRLLYGRLAAAWLAKRGQPALLSAVGSAQGEPVCERWGQVATVILAAGAATRMGRPKQVEPVAGVPMLLRSLAVAAGLGGPVFVVTGAHAERVMELLADLPQALAGTLSSRLHPVHNPAWAAGQASSLHTSIRALPGTVEAAIWLPVDQPYLDPSLLAQLAAAWRRGADLAAPTVDGELRGAPALFDRSRWPLLLQIQGDKGGRVVLRQYAAEVATVPVSATQLHDIDTPHDLAVTS